MEPRANQRHVNRVRTQGKQAHDRVIRDRQGQEGRGHPDAATLEGPDEGEEEGQAPDTGELERVDGVDEEGIEDEESQEPGVAQVWTSKAGGPDERERPDDEQQRGGPITKQRVEGGAGQVGRDAVGEGHGPAAVEQGDVEGQTAVMEDLVRQIPDVGVVLHRVVGEEQRVGAGRRPP